MKRNLIRGATLALIIVVFCLMGCATAKLSKNRQSRTQTEQSKSETTTGVAGQQADRNSQKTEELLQEQTTTITTQEGIPASEATVDVPIQNLLNLPDGAEFTAKDGQASVIVQRHGDNITVTGKCDSIARQCLFYEREVFRQRSEIDSLKRTISQVEQATIRNDVTGKTEDIVDNTIKEKPPATWYKWLLAGFTAGVLLTSPLKKLVTKVITIFK